MNSKTKWIAFGATGIVGLSLIAGGAAVNASTMDLRTNDGTEVPATLKSGKSVLDREAITLRVSDGAVSVVTAATAASAVSAPASPSAVSTVSTPSPISPVSAPTAASAASVPANETAPSPVSAPTPVSAPSPASAPSSGSVPSAPSN